MSALNSLKILAIIGVLFLQISCQNLPHLAEQATKNTTVDATGNDKKTLPENKKIASIKEPTKKYPNIKLTENMLNQYLLAEFAKQHKDYNLSFRHFMALAQSTQDSRIAKSTLRVALVSGNNEHILKAIQMWSKLEEKEALSADDQIEILQVKAVIFLNIGQDKLATQDLLNIINLTDVHELGVERAKVLISSVSDYSRLKPILNVFEKQFQNDFYINLLYAQLALKFQDYVQAEKSIDESLRLQPKNEQAYLLKAQLFNKLGQQNKNIAWYKYAIEQLDNPSLIRLEYTKVLLEKNQHDEVLEQLEYIIEDNKDNAHILYSIGMLAMDIKEYDQAELFFTKLYQLDEFREQGAFLLAILAYNQEKNAQALDWFAKISDKKYRYESILRVAIIYSEQKDYTLALSTLDEYLTSEGESLESKIKINLLRLKADVLNRARQYQQAYRVYTKALLEMPNNAEILYGRAMVAEKLERIDLSEKDLLQIIENDPKNSNAFNALGYILTENTTRYSDAKYYIEEALKIAPNDMAILDSMGWVLYKQGKIEDSLSYLKRAYHIQKDPEIAAHYGEVLWVSNQKEQAKKIWGLELKKNPEHDKLKSTIQKYINLG